MPQFQPQGIQYIGNPPGQTKSPIETLQQLMMVKMQFDEQEKMRQQQAKERMEELQMRHDMETKLIEFEDKLTAERAKEALKAQIEQTTTQIQQATSAAQGLPSDLQQMGQYYAQFGQALPASYATQPMQTERAKISAGATQKAAETRAGTQEKIAKMRTGAQKEVAGMRLKATEQKEKEEAEQRAQSEAIKEQRRIAKEFDDDWRIITDEAGGPEASDKDIVKAIRALANQNPGRFERFYDVIEQIERPWHKGGNTVKINIEKLKALRFDPAGLL